MNLKLYEKIIIIAIVTLLCFVAYSLLFDGIYRLMCIINEYGIVGAISALTLISVITSIGAFIITERKMGKRHN